MRKKIVAGNWKMNMTPKEAVSLVCELRDKFSNRDVDVVFCVPSIDIIPVVDAVKGTDIKVGAENMHYEEKGAYTGEISPGMLKEAGVDYVIVGHSERRQYFGETNDMINKKLKAALHHGIRPILCIGENLQQKELGTSKEVLKIQLREALQGIDEVEKIDIAYEPIRAIGTGKSATPEDVQEIHEYIRSIIGNEKSRIIYGGSVNDTNAESLISQPAINGFLIGSASLDPQKMLKILDVVSKRNS